MEYTFVIHIGDYGDSEVEFELTEDEAEIVDAAMDEGIESFSDIEELSDLYERVMEAAHEKLIEDIELTGDEIDVDDLDYVVDFQ